MRGTKYFTMKAIINGKRYNTTTADCIASYHNNRGSGDFRDLGEELYRTKKGIWFLAGRGGALTKYAVSVGNNGSCGGSKIIVLDDEEAREWLERHGEIEELENYFQIEDA